MRDVLEFTTIPKVFFDVRTDSDALFGLFGISLAGVFDLQVMEFGARTHHGRFVNGLASCIDRSLDLNAEQKEERKRIKEAGIKMVAPKHGGTFEVFNERPLNSDIVLYCVQDVLWLPKLFDTYASKLGKKRWNKVDKATKERLEKSWSAEYEGNGVHMAYGPW